MTNMKSHMDFPLTPRSMTLDDLELHKFEFSVNFSGISQISDTTTAKQMQIGQYCQRQRSKHVELEQFWHALASRGLSAIAGLSCISVYPGSFIPAAIYPGFHVGFWCFSVMLCCAS